MHEAANASDAGLGLNHDLPGSLCRRLRDIQLYEQSRGVAMISAWPSRPCRAWTMKNALFLTFQSVLTTGSLLVGTSSAELCAS